MKKITSSVLIFLAFAGAVLFSCKKDDISIPQPNLPDLQTRISSSVSGFVTDENNEEVPGALVRFGGSNTFTDAYGYFSFEGVEVIKNAAVVTVSHNRYLKGFKTFEAKADKQEFVRIKLSPRTVIGTINAVTGGNVSTPDGFDVAIPANAVVDNSTGAAYSGTITVTGKWLDPTSNDLAETMPGDLRALNTAGEMKLLATHGMAGIELTGDAGQQLKIAPANKSTLTFPIPSTIIAQAPSVISLWHFDEVKGLWIEGGTATKSGDRYVGEVSHFSFWNVGVAIPYVNFEVTVQDYTGQPIHFAKVKLTMVNSPYYSAEEYTDVNGYASGFVPADTDLTMEIYFGDLCTTPIHVQNIPGSSQNISLSPIQIAQQFAQVATVTGTVVNCTSTGVSNGYVITGGGRPFRYNCNDSGRFSFNVPICATGSSIHLTAGDADAMDVSDPVTINLNPGINDVGTLVACGNAASFERIDLNIDGVDYRIDGPMHNPYVACYPGNSNGPPATSIIIGGSDSASYFTFIFMVYDYPGLTDSIVNAEIHNNGSTYDLPPNSPFLTTTISPVVPVGSIMSFTFLGNFVEAQTSRVVPISGSVRVRRTE